MDLISTSLRDYSLEDENSLVFALTKFAGLLLRLEICGSRYLEVYNLQVKLLK